jgi:hypothetical protein
MIRLETIQKEKSVEKARLIAAAKQVRKSEVSHDVWLLSSGNPKASKRFHYVKREEGQDASSLITKHLKFRRLRYVNIFTVTQSLKGQIRDDTRKSR